MNAMERRSVLALSGVVSARMFGLFLLLPVLALHAAVMPGSTPFLVGLALGIYGLTQALFQLSFGMCSDIFGRRGVIAFGLLIFIAGSVVAALADTLPWLIAGRAIQGAGAVSSAVLALTADLTREEQRTKAMALIGISIGAVFLTSMALAPALSLYIGVQGLFWLTAGLGVVALFLLYGVVPSPSRHLRHRDVTPTTSRVPAVLRDPQLLRLNVGAFVLHLVLTALFVVVPAELSRMGDMALHEHWKVYFPVLLMSVIGMAPLIVMGSRTNMVAPMFRIAIFLLLAALGGFALVTWGDGSPFLWLPACLWVFFCGFNALEAMLPSLVSRVSPAADKGTAIGIFNTFQFFGVFVGGGLAGWMSGGYGAGAVFLLCAVLVLAWLVIAWLSPAFRLSSSRVIHIGDSANHSHREALVDRIQAVRGVQEVTIVRGETLAYLKVDDRELDIAALQKLDQIRGD